MSGFSTVLIRFWASLVSTLMGWVPKPMMVLFGRALAFLWWDVLAFRRFTLLRNITIVFPEKSKQERLQLVRESLDWLGYNFIEILKLPTFRHRDFESEVILKGFGNFSAAHAQGKGVIFLSLHIGNGDAAATWLSLFGLDIHLITKTFKNKAFNQVWFEMRGKAGTHFISAHGRETPFQILRALKNKGAVVFVQDQFMGRPFGIPTTFFGQNTGTAYGLALIAIKSGAPVQPVYTYRDKDLKTVIEFGPEIKMESHPDKDLQIHQMTEKYNRVLEQIIREHPKEWMWVHRRWKKYE